MSNPIEDTINSLNKITPDMGLEALAEFLLLDDKTFDTLAPYFLEEMEKDLNNPQNAIAMASALRQQGSDIKELVDNYNIIAEQLDVQLKDDLPQNKIDFIKRLIGITINCAQRGSGEFLDAVEIPLEVCNENAKVPVYAHVTDAAVDLYSPEEYIINPGEQIIIPTGLKMAIPKGYALLIQPRSGLTSKSKLRIANSPGLIDSGYRGEIGVIVENIEPQYRDIALTFDSENKIHIESVEYGRPYVIGKGERFAQARLVQVPAMNFYQVNNIENFESDRKDGGFGSSGTN